MNHHASPDFWSSYRALPADIREIADKAFALLKENPHHPSLHLKKVGQYWSARVGLRHRAVGVQATDGILRFWIGPHSEYNRLVRG